MLTDDDKRWLTGQLDERLDRVRVEFSERLEKVETTLLTEFHKWASPVETRQRKPRRGASRPG
jgi:hypothetical protein